MDGEQLEHGVRLEQEDARVPVEVAAVEIGFRGFERRLLHEALHPEVGAVARLGLDIAIAGVRAVGLDAEGDERARLGAGTPALDRAREGVFVAIMWSTAQAAPSRPGPRGGDQRGDAGRRRRVAALRLEHDRRRLCADLLELLGDQKAVAVIGQDVEIAEERPRSAAGRSAGTASRDRSGGGIASDTPRARAARAACPRRRTR